jgi:hypothetical protein
VIEKGYVCKLRTLQLSLHKCNNYLIKNHKFANCVAKKQQMRPGLSRLASLTEIIIIVYQ